jgi:hypothetical protein
MNVARAVLVTALLAGVVVLGGATAAHACSCRLDPESVAHADLAFIGHTTQSPDVLPGGVDSRYTFSIDQVIHGAGIGRVDVVSANQDSACGVIFIARRRYVVVADRGLDGTLRTGLCSGTTRATRAVLDGLKDADLSLAEWW